MRILSIGTGVVGLATGRGFARFGHEVMYYDTNPAAYSKLTESERKGIATDEDYRSADVCFVCVPEEAASDAVSRATLLAAKSAAIVIRSSVPPGTTAKLANELNRVLWHNPESLREAISEQDFLWAKHTIIGCTKRDVDPSGPPYASPFNLFLAYREMGVEVHHCHSTESELVKLFTNNYLATLITFWNQAKVLADKLEVNSHKVARLVALDERVSKYGAYMHGVPYGGHCLPKDMAQTLKLAESLGTALPLLEAIHEINLWLGGT